MALSVLLQTSIPSAEATVERLDAAGIEAFVIDRPNAIAWIATGGNYRVRVVVPEEALDAARGELARWEVEARPRIRALSREVQRALALASLPALFLGAGLFLARSSSSLAWTGVVILWLAGLGAWTASSRLRSRRGA